MKVGASAVVARRGGISSTYDEINKFFAISGMPIASSQYWNSIHGREMEKQVKMKKDYKQCVFLLETCHF